MITYLLTKFFTNIMYNDISKKQKKNVVRYSKYLWMSGIFLIFIGVVFFFAITISAPSSDLIYGLIPVLIFGALGTSIFLLGFNYGIFYDEYGFTHRTPLRVKHRYSYSEITGMGCKNGQLLIQVNNQKTFNLSYLQMRGGLSFSNMIFKKCQGKSYKDLNPSMMRLTPENTFSAYESGTLGKASLVPEGDEYTAAYRKFKALHIVICILGAYCAFSLILSVFLFKPTLHYYHLCLAKMFFCEGLFWISVWLYFKYPNYFSARQKDSHVKIKRIHKLSTFTNISLMNILGSMILFIFAVNFFTSLSNYHFNTPVHLLIVGIVLIAYIFLIIYTKKHSWEYLTYKVGLISAGFFYFLHFCSFILLWICFYCCTSINSYF